MTKTQPQTPAPAFISLHGFECVAHDGDFYFTAAEVGKQLGYEDPANSVNRIYARNVEELQDFTTSVKMTDERGTTREHRVFSEEGVYLISFLAQTDQARAFRRSVAALLKHLRRRKLLQAKAEGVQAALGLSEVMHANLRHVVRYRAMGLTTKEIGKLMDCDYTWVNKLMIEARALGLEVR